MSPLKSYHKVRIQAILSNPAFTYKFDLVMPEEMQHQDDRVIALKASTMLLQNLQLTVFVYVMKTE